MLESQCGTRGNALGLKEDPIYFPLQSDICPEIASTSPWQAPPRPVMVRVRDACTLSLFWPYFSSFILQLWPHVQIQRDERIVSEACFCREKLFGSWWWVGKGRMQFGAAANCTWPSAVLCKELPGDIVCLYRLLCGTNCLKDSFSRSGIWSLHAYFYLF